MKKFSMENFIFCAVYIHQVPTKLPQEKLWTHENTHEKKYGPTKYQREKNLDPRNTHEKKLVTHEGTVA